MRTIATLALALTLALAGCGGDDEEQSSGAATPSPTPEAASGGGGAYGGGGDSSSDGGGGEPLRLAAPGSGARTFQPATLTAPAGPVTIEFDNPSQVPHAVEIEAGGATETSETVTGGSTSVTADLEPGEYPFYCPVGDHRAEGMEGTLTVE